MAHSDYYFSGASLPLEFSTENSGVYTATYVRSADELLEEHAVLTFLDITVNGDSNWNYRNTSAPPDPGNMPRFVDISVGLISSTDITTAQLKNDEQYVRDHEQVYFRRIHLHNKAPETFSFK
jgi:hypothetical protein